MWYPDATCRGTWFGERKDCSQSEIDVRNETDFRREYCSQIPAQESPTLHNTVNNERKFPPHSPATAAIYVLAQDIAELVRREPSHVQLDWVLRLIQHIITADPHHVYIVDLVPNLKWLVRNTSLVKECAAELAAFEEKVGGR